MTASSVRREPRDVWFLWRDGLWLQMSTKSLERHRPRQFHQRDISEGAIKLLSCQRQLSHSSQLLPAYQGLQFTAQKRRSEAQHRRALAGSRGWQDGEGSCRTSQLQPSTCPAWSSPGFGQKQGRGDAGHQPQHCPKHHLEAQTGGMVTFFA